MNAITDSVRFTEDPFVRGVWHSPYGHVMWYRVMGRAAFTPNPGVLMTEETHDQISAFLRKFTQSVKESGVLDAITG